MGDVVDPRTRSRMMAGIQGKNTKPEVVVRKCLFGLGYRYRLHRRDLPGVPDLVLSGQRIAVFVHGCFWHSHKNCKLVKSPKTNAEFWREKLGTNVTRDLRSVASLRALDWRVLVVWGCSTRGEALAKLPGALSGWIKGDAPLGEIPRDAKLGI